jgi:hypothetical protein
MVTTTSLAQEKLRMARAVHAFAQRNNTTRKTPATVQALARAEASLAAAEAQVANAVSVALVAPVSGRRLVAR